MISYIRKNSSSLKKISPPTAIPTNQTSKTVDRWSKVIKVLSLFTNRLITSSSFVSSNTIHILSDSVRLKKKKKKNTFLWARPRCHRRKWILEAFIELLYRVCIIDVVLKIVNDQILASHRSYQPPIVISSDLKIPETRLTARHVATKTVRKRVTDLRIRSNYKKVGLSTTGSVLKGQDVRSKNFHNMNFQNTAC